MPDIFNEVAWIVRDVLRYSLLAIVGGALIWQGIKTPAVEQRKAIRRFFGPFWRAFVIWWVCLGVLACVLLFAVVINFITHVVSGNPASP